MPFQNLKQNKSAMKYTQENEKRKKRKSYCSIIYVYTKKTRMNDKMYYINRFHQASTIQEKSILNQVTPTHLFWDGSSYRCPPYIGLHLFIPTWMAWALWSLPTKNESWQKYMHGFIYSFWIGSPRLLVLPFRIWRYFPTGIRSVRFNF